MTISIYNSYNLVPGVNNFNVSDEIIVRDSLDVYEVIELDFGNTKQSLNFGPNQYADYGTALDSLDAFDSFAISFWIRQDNGDNSPIFSLYDSEQYTIVDLSNESNSLTLLDISGSVRVPISTGRASLFMGDFNDGIRADSAVDSINFNSPFSIEYRWSRGSPDDETNTMFSISKGHDDLLTVDGTGIIVNNVKLSFDDPTAVSHSHVDILASRNKALNPELLWDHYALGYDGLDYKFFKSGTEVSYTRDEKYMAKKGDLQFTDLPDLRNDAGFQTWAYFPQDAASYHLFHAGDSINRVEFKTQGNNLILKAGGDVGPSLTVEKPPAGKHNIAWDVKIDPGQVRLWINDSYAGSSSIATPLPGKKWAGDGIIPLLNYTNTYSGNITHSRTMVTPESPHTEYIEGSVASPWATTSTFEDCNDGKFKYHTAAPSLSFWSGPRRWLQYYYYHSVDRAYKNHRQTLREPPNNGQPFSMRTFRNTRATAAYSYRSNRNYQLLYGPPGSAKHVVGLKHWRKNYPSRNHVTLSDVTISKGGSRIFYFEHDYKKRPIPGPNNNYHYNYSNDVVLHLSEKGFRSNTSFFYTTPDLGEFGQSNNGPAYAFPDDPHTQPIMSGINTSGLRSWAPYTGDLVPSEINNHQINNFRAYEADTSWGGYDRCDQWFISEPDERLYCFRNGRYHRSFDFPPSGTHFEVLFFKGKYNYYLGAVQGSPGYGHFANMGLEGEEEFLLNRYTSYNFSPDCWDYDPSRLFSTVPALDRRIVAGGGAPAGYGKLGSLLWPEDLKDSLYTYPIAFDDYKDANLHIGAKLKDLSNPDETGLQYANKFISETGGSIVNYTGGQGSDIKDAINATADGDALILPAGNYTMSYNNGRDILNGKNILICGPTNNMRDVKLELTNSSSYYIFWNDHRRFYSRAEIAYLSIEGWTYGLVRFDNYNSSAGYGNFGNHKIKNVKFTNKRGIFYYNVNTYPGKKLIIENCIFDKPFTVPANLNQYNVSVKNCIFTGLSGNEGSPGYTVDYIPTFTGINKTGIDVDFKSTSDSSQYLDLPYDLIKDVSKDFTSYVYDFNILDSNRYDSAYDVSISNADLDDSHTKLSINPVITKGNIFTYTSRASATSIRPAFIVDNELLEGDSFPIPNGAEWEYQSIQYNGTSLKLYIDGVLNKEINADLNFNDIKNTSLLLGRLSNYEFTENRFAPEYNTSLNLRDFVVTRGQTYLTDFTPPIDSYGTIGANDVLFTATGAPYPDMPGITNYDVSTVDISPFDHPLSGKSFLKITKLNTSMGNITLGTETTKRGQTVQVVDFTSTLNDSDFTRPSYEINLRNIDDRGDSISWSYETTMPKRLIDIRSDSAKNRFYIDPTNSDETDFSHSLGIRFTGKNKIYPDRGPWLFGPDDAHISDSYRPDMTLVYDYHPPIGLSISAMSDPHISRFQTTKDRPLTIDSARYTADPFNILTPEKL
tara:strand:- start:22215 stop:26576 length:4362 start_codon:yes stop_codon:yes gene_type:complete